MKAEGIIFIVVSIGTLLSLFFSYYVFTRDFPKIRFFLVLLIVVTPIINFFGIVQNHAQGIVLFQSLLKIFLFMEAFYFWTTTIYKISFDDSFITLSYLHFSKKYPITEIAKIIILKNFVFLEGKPEKNKRVFLKVFKKILKDSEWKNHFEKNGVPIIEISETNISGRTGVDEILVISFFVVVSLLIFIKICQYI